MYIVEIGLLNREYPLVCTGFYRKDENLTEGTKKEIFVAIYAIISELFKNHVLKQLTLGQYTILFYGFDMASVKTTIGVDVNTLVLSYIIVDSEGQKIDREFMKLVRAKMNLLSETFRETYASLDFQSGSIDTDFSGFVGQIVDVFKDLLKTPQQRFDNLWGKT
jgi:hypothetical protein